MASTVTHTGGGRGRGGRVTPGKAWRSLRSALPVAMAAAIFAWDLGTPPGVAIGVLYVMPVIFSLWQPWAGAPFLAARSEEHTSELQSLMSTSYAVFCLTTKKTTLNYYT